MTTRAKSGKGTVYFIKLDSPLANPSHPAGHSYYVGSTPTRRLAQRLEEHATGTGARFIARALADGIAPLLLATVEFDTVAEARAYEARIKASKNTPRYVKKLAAAGKLIGDGQGAPIRTNKPIVPFIYRLSANV